MLARLSRPMLRMLYSTQEKVNVVVVPKRWQLPFKTFSMLETQITTAPSCKTLAVLIKENLELFSDEHICQVFNQIGRYNLVVDDHFHTVIAPIAVEWIKTFDRNNSPTLTNMFITLLGRNIQSPELEQAIVKKLDDQNIYRYINLRDMPAVFLQMSKHPRFHNTSLFKKIQEVIYQQKNYYSHFPQIISVIREGMEAVEKAGEKPLEIQQAYKQIS